MNRNNTALCRLILILVFGICCLLPAAGNAGGPELTSLQQYDYADQLIIRFRSDAPVVAQPPTREQVLLANSAAELSLTHVRPMSGGAHVFKLPSRMAVAEARVVARRLMLSPEIEYAEPDIRLFPLLSPNDPSYVKQWHYLSSASVAGSVNLPAAWDITTGSAGVVVAVIDTGIVSHADLAGRTVPGYNFISDPFKAGNGIGRTADAADLGDFVTQEDSADWFSPVYGCYPHDSSWHGTHVAGTIGAASNNSLGVAGINWVSKILPVRVLGKCGGSTSDIVDGMRWAAGLPVPGVPDNPNPAKVLNLSLGGGQPCTAAEQAAVNDIVQAGAVIVVAAGNNATDAAFFTPASCNGVVSVASVNRAGGRAYYSNYGETVVVAAPGGETARSDSDGVLSTMNTGTRSPVASPAGDTYNYYQGTSMAAPHAAGILSLVLSANSALTPTQVAQLVQATARPFPTATGSLGGDCTTSLCGAGIIDAARLVQAAAAASPYIGTLPGKLKYFAEKGGSSPAAQPLRIANVGKGTLNWSAAPDAAWVGVAPASGTGDAATAVSLDVTGFSSAGTYTASITITGTGAGNTPVVIPVSLDVSDLHEALDERSLTWATGGDAPWFSETAVTYDGVSAAQSGKIREAQASWLETTVIGSGAISFAWRISSEAGRDSLRFFVDGVEQAGAISGKTEWARASYDIIGAGTHSLRWVYAKDYSVSAGSDAAWVDTVAWYPGLCGTLTISPSAKAVSAAAVSSSITVTASSTCPWTAVSTVPWITVTGGAAGAGNGTVSYAVSANTATASSSRIGSIYVSGRSFTVVQSGMLHTLKLHTPMPVPVFRHASAGIGSKMYLIGGLSAKDWHEKDVVQIYDTVTDTWALGAAKPTASAMSSAAVINGKIYVAGGYQVYTGKVLSTLEIYDPATNTWSAGASLPAGLAAAGAEALNNKLYVFGGNNEEWVVVQNTLIYDPVTNAWSSAAAMNDPRAYFGTGVLNGKIYAFGGYSGPGFGTSAEVYDPVQNTWTPIAPMHTGRYDFGGAALNNKIHAFGGNAYSYWDAPYQQDIEVYDPATNTWSPDPLSLNIARQGERVAVMGTSLYVTGGYNSDDVNINESYEPAACLASGSIAPAGKTVASIASSGTISVAVSSGCPWSAVSTVPWITLTSGAAGSGSGTVNYAVSANNGVNTPARIGTILVAGRVHTVIQSGTLPSLTLHAPMPVPVFRHAAAAIGTKMYAIGGMSSIDWREKDVVQIYDSATGAWSMGAPKPTAAAITNAAVINGKIYVPGGYQNSTGTALSTFEIYDPAANTWSTGTAMPVGLYGAGVEALNNKLYVMGGEDGSYYHAETWVYDPNAGTWSPAGYMNQFREFFGTGVISGKIYAFGGEAWGYHEAGAEVYDPALNAWTPVASMNTARYDLGGAALNGRLYAFGGNSHSWWDAPYQQDIETYDPATNTWSFVPQVLNVARQGLKAVPVGGSVYVTGGYNGGDVNINESYDTAACLSSISISPSARSFLSSASTGTLGVTATAGCSWSAASTVPWITITGGASGSGNGTVSFAVSGNTGTTEARIGSIFVAGKMFTVTQSGRLQTLTLRTPMPVPVLRHAVARVGTKMYVIGGTSTRNWMEETDIVQIYDTATGAWTFGAPKPTAAESTHAAVINGKIYVPGGYQPSTGTALSTLEIYDPVTNAWSTGPAMPGGLYAAGVEGLNNKLYVMGGEDGSYLYAETHIYDPATGTWSNAASMYYYREYFATGTINGKIYAFGGTGTEFNATAEVFDPVLNTWTPVASMNTRRFDVAGAALNGKLYAFGGNANSYWNAPYQQDIEVYDPATNIWSLDPLSLNVARQGLRAVAMSGSVYVTGGYNGGDVNINESYDSGSCLAAGSISPLSKSFLSSSGTGTIGVTASTGCAWTAKSAVPWITVTGGAAGSGNGMVSYTVSANTGTTGARTGTIFAAGRAFNVTQSGTVPTLTLHAPMPIAVMRHAAASIGTKMYVIGGSMGVEYPYVQIYDTATGTWTFGANKPTAVESVKAAVINGKIYVPGGYRISSAMTVSVLEIYDPVLDTWSTGPVLPVALKSAGVAALNNKLYVMGGENDSYIYKHTLVFDPAGNTWSTAANMNDYRAQYGTAVVSGKVYAFGGYNVSARVNSAEVFDPGLNSWVAIASMPAARYDLGGAALNGKAYAFGGNANSWWDPPYQQDIVVYDPGTNTWSPDPVYLNVARQGLTAVAVGGSLYVTGGYHDGYVEGITESYDPGCSYGLSPSAVSVNATGGSGSVSLAAIGTACSASWAAVSGVPWVAVTGGASGVGNGTVSYTVSSNTGTLPRSGAITVAGQQFFLSQAQSAGISLGDALNNTSLVWTTGGGASWYGESGTSHDGASAAQAGPITHGQVSWLETMVDGMGSGSFWWKVSSEASGDYLRFFIDGVEQATGISGSVDWAQVNFATLSTGLHTLKWEYAKNASVSSGSDAGWVDQVVWSRSTCNDAVIDPSTSVFSSGTATASLRVVSAASCLWSAASTTSWITVTGGASGSGNGAVSILLSANSGTVTRTGSLSIAGRKVEIWQYGHTAAGYLHGAPDPWSTSTSERALSMAFGPEGTGWTNLQLADGPAPFQSGSGYRFIFMDGSFYGDRELQSYLTTHRGLIETWVRSGGRLFINSAPWYVYHMDLGFNGAALDQYWPATNPDTVQAANAGHPIFQGPFVPVGTTFTGNNFAGATAMGPGAIPVLVDSEKPDRPVVSELRYGAGIAFFGGMTPADFTQPHPNVVNLRANIFDHVATAATVSTVNIAVLSSAASGTLNVYSGATRTWSAASQNAWVTITSGASGTGNGSIGYTVAANSGATRAGAIVVSGQTVTITQSASNACNAMIAPPVTATYAAEGGAGSAVVSATGGCGWTASAGSNWITISSGATGTGNGSVGYLVSAFTGTQPRVGTLTIAGQTLTITQAPASIPLATAVDAPLLTWTTGGNAPWFGQSAVTADRVDAGQSGRITDNGQSWLQTSVTGTGVGSFFWAVSSEQNYDYLRFTVDGVEQTAGISGLTNWAQVNFTISTAGTHTLRWTYSKDGSGAAEMDAGWVDQVAWASSVCSAATITPVSQQFLATGGTGTATVMADAGCAWNTYSEVPWITITSGASGTGNGSVRYTVSPNTGAGTPARSGSIIIAGRSFSITQKGTALLLTSRTPEPTPLMRSAVAAAGGKLYVVGGRTARTAAESGAVQVLDTATGSWSAGAGKPTTATNAAAAALNGKIYVAGGYQTSTGQTLDAFEIYDPDADAWASGPELPTPLSGASAAVLQGKFYVLGGDDGSGNSKRMYQYDPATGVWLEAAAMNEARSYFGSGTVNGMLYAFGGNGASGYLGSAEQYDPATGVWSFIAPMNVGRYDLAGASGSGKLYAFGGNAAAYWDAPYQGDVEVYDPATNAWTIDALQLNAARQGLRAAAVGSGIYVAGGYNGAATDTTESYDLPGCTYALDPADALFPYSAGTATITVNAIGTGCGSGWTAVSNNAWITVASGASGAGTGKVRLSIAANTGAARSGTVTIAGQTAAIRQKTSVCSTAATPLVSMFTAETGTGAVSIVREGVCSSWTATTGSSWLTITNGGSGTGNGTVSFTVSKNTGTARIGSLTAAGQIVYVGQSTKACTYGLGATQANFLETGGTGTVSLSASGSACGGLWSAVSNTSWITVTEGAGVGPGAISYSVAPNSGAARTGTITVAGLALAVSQAMFVDRIPDAFAFTPVSNAKVKSLASSNTVTITGITVGVPISITGGKYLVSGGVYTSATGTVTNGKGVTVQLTSSTMFSTATSATLTIGGVAGVFTVTTEALDTTPDLFTFPSVTDAPLNSGVTSSIITVTGINAPAPVSITGGMYSLNNGPYTGVSGTAVSGSTVRVMLVSSGNALETRAATLAIGGVSGDFVVTSTGRDSVPDPFVFPDLASAPAKTAVYSEPVTISGINTAATISITGGSYLVSGGTYTGKPGIVLNGQTVTLKTTSPAAFSASKTVTLYISGVPGTWKVTTEPADTTPDPFSFAPVTNAARNAAVASAPITVSGINTAATISIAGGRYMVSGGTYTTVAGTITSGKTVTVQVTSAATFSATTAATLYIGGVPGAFSVTTLPADRTPNAFAFTPVSNALINGVYTSNTVTITGINTGTPISITGGQYQVNGGVYTGASGTITNNKSVAIQVTAPPSYGATGIATLTIGDVQAIFSVTTQTANTASLNDAVDNQALSFLTGTIGAAEGWFGQDAVFKAGASAAQSGVTGDNGTSFLETTVSGPFSVSFLQKVSSEAVNDYLLFTVDGIQKAKTSGENDWKVKGYSILTEGPHTLRWAYIRNGSISGGRNAAWVDRIVTSPVTTLTVLSPAAGETVPAGSVRTIAWQAPANAEKYILSYSTDSGATWSAMTTTFVTGTSYDWGVPSLSANKPLSKIRIVAYDLFSAVAGTAISPAPFKIEVLRVASPNGGEIITGGTSTAIDFSISGSAPTAVSIAMAYTVDNGATWTAIPTAEPVSPGAHTVPWAVPAVGAVKAACKIRVQLKDAAGTVLTSDTSDAVFTLSP